jgi:hypothetical protein
VTRIKPGSGTIVVDLGKSQVVTLDLAAFLNALHQEVTACQDGMQRLVTDNRGWQELVSVALRRSLSRPCRGAQDEAMRKPSEP